MSKAMKISMALNLAMSGLMAFEAAKSDDGRITPDEYDDLLAALLPGLEMAGVDRGTIFSLQSVLKKISAATDDKKLSLAELADTLGAILEIAGVPVEWDFGEKAPVPDEHEGPTTQA